MFLLSRGEIVFIGLSIAHNRRETFRFLSIAEQDFVSATVFGVLISSVAYCTKTDLPTVRADWSPVWPWLPWRHTVRGPFFDEDLIPPPPPHPSPRSHFLEFQRVTLFFLLLFAYSQCNLGSLHAQFLLFATASRSKCFFDLPSVTRDAVHQRLLTLGNFRSFEQQAHFSSPLYRFGHGVIYGSGSRIDRRCTRQSVGWSFFLSFFI